jgi:hypothetical protein
VANVGVTFDFAAESAKLRSEVDKVRREMSSIKQSTQALEKGFKALGGFIVGAFSVGAITSFLSRVNQAADQLDGLSQRLSSSASGLQTLQIAAAQAGGSAEAMNTALAKLSVSLGDALAGSKPVNEALSRLGLSAKELAGLKTDEAMRRIAGALSEVGNSYERASISQAIFGKGAKELQEFFAVAPGQISETEQALARAGAALDDIDIAKIGAMNDDLAMQTTIVQNLGIKFLAGLSPAVNVATDAFADLVSNLGGATAAGRGFGVVMVGAIKLVEAGVYSLAAVFESMRFTVARILEFLVSGVARITSSLASAASAVGAAGLASGLRSASEGAAGFAVSFGAVADSAKLNAQAAAAAAINAGAQMLQAGIVFDQQAAALEARAQAAVDRVAQVQGGAGGIAAGAAGAGAGSAAGGGLGPLLSKDLLKDTGRSIADFDPLSDPQVLRQIEINSALQAIEDEHRGTMLGKIEAFNETALGSILSYGQMQIDFEQSKGMIIGELANNLVSTAMQAGGRLGKFGKALAIAQTIWNTGQAVMTAMAQVPWPANIAAAALAAATGVAQLANIRKTNIGSGGSIAGARGGGISASAPSLNDNVAGAQPQQQEQAVTQVVIQGNVFSSQETASWIIEQIRDAVQTRDVVFISSNSRQAMELAGT